MAQLKTVQADLRAKYKRYFEISLIIALLMLIAAFKFSPNAVKIKPIKNGGCEIIKVENIPTTQHEITKPKEPKPVVPILSLSDETEDIPFDDTDIFSEDIRDIPQPQLTSSRIIVQEDLDFKPVEDYPELIGGMKSLQEKLYYTEIAKRIGIEGKVIVTALIDKNGDVVGTGIYKSLFEDLDKIAVNAVKELKFIPGKQRGKPVKVKIYIPIHFKLN